MLVRETTPTRTATSHGPVRGFDLPPLALRRRSSDHPMAMFAVIATAAFLSMTLLPGQRPAEAAIPGADETLGQTRAGGDAERRPADGVDGACRGQAWGEESLACLIEIAKASGKEQGPARLVASVEPDRTTPNIF